MKMAFCMHSGCRLTLVLPMNILFCVERGVGLLYVGFLIIRKLSQLFGVMAMMVLVIWLGMLSSFHVPMTSCRA
ncbi:hypothetical protein HanRHA438_Chr13g0616321 [Helianthus annuus]|uniref:Uncharacterized protein n=1 Tax=Helianthus annuus TaxID=4232 RepID=A0A9K3EK99_HELAN|nr:hypothetical protein HanXRQr2_Chr13g0605831 [Helianthus annuus]KAJ0478133.1 hypothetical protein HanHA300_Chr13g0496791 [Helianthus annuus]KAJ0499015.1 hypothetical protein HanHA89_Chr13g0529441 [Helianthus annuus]KAJ0665029.1 hypothetical protein HanLR1_Chr13g0499471 [Helianthus annuus]KAJ0672451.1 hypothetical protein HanOQP8_Chr13g0497461 [Helianthus annuus]